MRKLLTIVCIALGACAYGQEDSVQYAYLYSQAFEIEERIDGKWVEEERVKSPTYIAMTNTSGKIAIKVTSEDVPVYTYTIVEHKTIGPNEYDMVGATQKGAFRRLILSMTDNAEWYLTIMPVNPTEEDNTLIIFYINNYEHVYKRLNY